MKRLSLEYVKQQCSKIHHNKYDYSQIIVYENKNQKVTIVCPEHGEFQQSICNHLHHKRGCPTCGLRIRRRVENPIDLFRKVHGDKYDYSLVRYVSKRQKISILCRKHGIFYQTPTHHLRGSGCPDCGKFKMSLSLVKDKNLFLSECSNIHFNYYDYSKVDFNNLQDKIKIICPIHGEFSQRAYSHKEGYGCRKCNISKGEKRIELFLLNNNIKYEYNKHFDTCKNKNTLPFDFYLPDFKTCIEYDGIQHFESIEHFGGEQKLNYQKKLDNIKNIWCYNMGIGLIRISYKKYDDIENILKVFLYKR